MKFGFHLLYNASEGIYYIKIIFNSNSKKTYSFGNGDSWLIVCFES